MSLKRPIFSFFSLLVGKWVLEFSAKPSWSLHITFFAAPSPPRELRLTVKNASVILMSWTRPDVLNGYLRTILYRINYTPANGNISKDFFTQHSSSGSPQNFTLQSLSPDTVFSINVYAGRRRNDGVERWSEEVSKTATTLQLGENN